MVFREDRTINNSWVDVIRGLAILNVVSVHVIQITNNILIAHSMALNDYTTELLSFGRYGVELFFFISGFLLCSIYELNRSRLGLKYFVRRIARIYPLWVIFLLFQIVRAKIGNGEGGWRIATSAFDGNLFDLHSPIMVALLSLTFMLWISPLLWNTVIPGGWSIQCEVAHYIIFPLFRRLPLSRMLHILISVNVLTLVVRELVHLPINDNRSRILIYLVDTWIRLNLFSTFCYFFIGIVFCCAYQLNIYPFRITDALKELGLSKMSVCIFLVSLFGVPLNFGNNIESLIYVFLMIILGGGLNTVRFARKVLTIVGKYSYFVYFCHFQVLSLVMFISVRVPNKIDFPNSQLIIFIVIYLFTICLSLVLGRISYKLIEAPIIKISRSITN